MISIVERSRKRHKTDENATLAKRKKALTSRSLLKDYELSSSGEDEEKDSFELPEVDFVVTPALLRNSREKNAELAPSVTPESVVQGVEKRKKETKMKGSTCSICLVMVVTA